MLLVLTLGIEGRADEVAVPLTLQAELLAKVAGYDKNLPARAGAVVHTLIVTKSGSGDSARTAAGILNGLKAQGAIAGLAHDEAVVVFTDATGLAQTCRDKHAAIVYLTQGFSDDEIASVAKGLEGADVLSAGAVAGFVPKGIVLGFDLVSGKPKLLVHLGQAKKQNVALSASVLKLMTVYE